MTMMMTNRKYCLILIALLAVPVTSFSQDDDFGIWLGADASHKIFSRLEADISGSLRTAENSKTIDQYFAEGGLSYKLNKTFSVGSSYRLLNKIENNSDYYFRHKFFLYTKASVPVGRFEFSSKLAYQRTVRTYIENDNDLLPESLLRLKLKADYDIQSSPFKPYLSCEPFYILSSNDQGLSKTRFSAGFNVRITPKSSVDAGYIFENNRKAQTADSHIISVKYNFKF
jgi:hypothetical protein